MSYASWRALRELINTPAKDFPRKYPFLIGGMLLLAFCLVTIFLQLPTLVDARWVALLGFALIFIDFQYPKKLWWWVSCTT